MPRKTIDALEGVFDPESDSLVLYYHEIEGCRGLPEEEERSLAKRIKEGDSEAVNILVEANLRFVIWVAKEYQNNGLPISDLISSGNLGLVTAAKRFDGEKGFKFISYAVWWIRQAMLQALAEQLRNVRLPLNKIGLLAKLSKADRVLTNKLNREPTPKEVIEALKTDEVDSVEELEDLRMLSKRDHHLDGVVDHDTRTTYMDQLVDEGILQDEIFEIFQSKKELVSIAQRCLEDREWYIIKRYFGLDSAASETLEQIGVRIGLTRERVRQIKEKALQKIRLYFLRNRITRSF